MSNHIKTCFTCKHLIDRHPLTAEAIAAVGHGLRCALKFETMKQMTLGWDELCDVKKQAIDAASNCMDYKGVNE